MEQREESSYVFPSEDLAALVGILRWDDSTDLFLIQLRSQGLSALVHSHWT